MAFADVTSERSGHRHSHHRRQGRNGGRDAGGNSDQDEGVHRDWGHAPGDGRSGREEGCLASAGEDRHRYRHGAPTRQDEGGHGRPAQTNTVDRPTTTTERSTTTHTETVTGPQRTFTETETETVTETVDRDRDGKAWEATMRPRRPRRSKRISPSCRSAGVSISSIEMKMHLIAFLPPAASAAS